MPTEDNYISKQGISLSILHYDFAELEEFRSYISTLEPKIQKDYELLYRGNGGTTFFLLNDGRIAEDGQTYAQIHSSYDYFAYYMSRAWGNGKIQTWPKRLITGSVNLTDKIKIYSIISVLGDILTVGARIEFGDDHLIFDTISTIPTGGFLFQKGDTYFVSSSYDFVKLNSFIKG